MRANLIIALSIDIREISLLPAGDVQPRKDSFTDLLTPFHMTRGVDEISRRCDDSSQHGLLSSFNRLQAKRARVSILPLNGAHKHFFKNSFQVHMRKKHIIRQKTSQKCSIYKGKKL